MRRWGGKNMGYSIFMLKNHNVFVPAFENKEPKWDNSLKMTGETSDGAVTFWSINDKKDSQRVEYVLEKDTNLQQSDLLSFIYGEGLYDYTTDDNYGKTCFDVFVEYEKKVPQEDPEFKWKRIQGTFSVESKGKAIELPALKEDIKDIV